MVSSHESEILIAEADDIINDRPEEAYQAVWAWLKETNKENSPALQSDAWDFVGRYHMNFGRYLESRHAYEKALDYAKDAEDSFRCCKTQKNLGALLMKMSYHQHALRYFLEARETAITEHYMMLQGQVENNIAVIHMMNGNYEEALIIFQLLLENVEAMNLSYAIAYYNLADVYLLLGKLDQVPQYIRKGKKSAVLEKKQYLLAGFAYFSGALMLRLKRFTFAETQLKSAYEQCKEYHMGEEEVRCLYELVLLYEETGDINQMIAYCMETIQYAEQFGGMEEVLFAHEKLVAAWNQACNGEKVWETSKRYAAYIEKRIQFDKLMKHLLMEMEIELLENEREKRRLEKKLSIDPLTGLESYHVLEARMTFAIQSSLGEYTVMFLDLDYLKLVNDQYGHDIGDILIITFAHEMKKFFSSRDTITRKSGDEFVIFMPNTDSEKAYQLASEFLQIAAIPRLIGTVNLPLACSIGIASSHIGNMEPDMLIDLSDKAMLQAKREGRLRIVVHKQAEGNESREGFDISSSEL